jgi:hypothetical protein
MNVSLDLIGPLRLENSADRPVCDSMIGAPCFSRNVNIVPNMHITCGEPTTVPITRCHSIFCAIVVTSQPFSWAAAIYLPCIDLKDQMTADKIRIGIIRP